MAPGWLLVCLSEVMAALELAAGGWVNCLSAYKCFHLSPPAATAFNTILQTIFDKIEYKFVGEWKEVMPTGSTWIRFAFFLPVSSHHIPASVMRPETEKKSKWFASSAVWGLSSILQLSLEFKSVKQMRSSISEALSLYNFMCFYWTERLQFVLLAVFFLSTDEGREDNISTHKVSNKNWKFERFFLFFLLLFSFLSFHNFFVYISYRRK